MRQESKQPQIYSKQSEHAGGVISVAMHSRAWRDGADGLSLMSMSVEGS